MSQWRLDFAGPDNVRRQAVVTAVSHRGNDYAWYRGEEFDITATAFAVDGGSATMRVDVTTAEGERLEVTLHGVIDGDHVSGEALWKTKHDDGAFPFSGVME